MIIHPENNYVLCEKIIDDNNLNTETSIIYDEKLLPEYKVISVSKSPYDIFSVIPGDTVICNSTGMKIKNNDNIQYLFKYENLIGKIID